MSEEIFYIHDEITHNSRAAEIILPLLFNIYRPGSILDVGCGLGNWLEVAARLGVKENKGIDGDYIDRSMLKIKEDDFMEGNLDEFIDLKRKFDLVICLEVAEHLLPGAANNIIKTLTAHGDVILFSAAIPGQGGQLHVNEQWPTYWQEKFRNTGYEMIDYFRPLIWNNEKVEYWYRQNLFLVVRKGHPLENIGTKNILPLVHPELFRKLNDLNTAKVADLRAKCNKLASRDIFTRLKNIFSKSN